MRFRFASLALVGAVSLMGLALAHAQPKLQPRGGGGTEQPQSAPAQGVIDRLTPDVTMGLLKQAGFSDLEIYSDNSGKKHVRGKINGQNVAVLHYCNDNGACQYISFVLPLGKQDGVDLNWVNSWNYDKLFGKLSQDKEGNTYFQMECYLFGGVAPAHVVSSAQLFAELIKVLYQYKPG